MTGGGTRPGALSVAADLTVGVIAPDGVRADLAVSDRAGEVVLDIRGSVGAVVRSLPPGALAAARQHRDLARLPPMRVRTRGVTLAVLRHGRPRPGAAVAGLAAAALVTVVMAGAGAAALARSLVGARRG